MVTWLYEFWSSFEPILIGAQCTCVCVCVFKLLGFFYPVAVLLPYCLSMYVVNNSDYVLPSEN